MSDSLHPESPPDPTPVPSEAARAAPAAVASVTPAPFRSAPEQAAKSKTSERILAGKYRIQKEIARGAMGRVFLAEQITLRRQVAIKVLLPKFTNPDFDRRFLLEAQSVAALQHPNIVTIHDYGKTKLNILFCVMEFLDGPTLAQLIRHEGKIRLGRAAHVVLQIAKALRAAHGHGLVHRDLKPGNIMLLRDDEGADLAKVLDFGLAKVFAGDDEGASADDVTDHNADPLTREGLMLGTPRYMAPEQILGKAVSPATDLYSLGAVFYQMLTGVPPYQGESDIDILHAQLKTRPQSLSTHPGCETLPPGVVALVDKCLEKKPADRPQTAQEFIDVLREIVSVSFVDPAYAEHFQHGERHDVNASLLAQTTIRKFGSSTGSTPALSTTEFDSTIRSPSSTAIAVDAMDSNDGMPSSFFGDAPEIDDESSEGSAAVGSAAVESAAVESAAIAAADDSAIDVQSGDIVVASRTPGANALPIDNSPYQISATSPSKGPLAALVVFLLVVPLVAVLWWFNRASNDITLTSTPSALTVVSENGTVLGVTPISNFPPDVRSFRLKRGGSLSKPFTIGDGVETFHADAAGAFEVEASTSGLPTPENVGEKNVRAKAVEQEDSRAPSVTNDDDVDSATKKAASSSGRRSRRAKSRTSSTASTAKAPVEATPTAKATPKGVPILDDERKPSVGLIDSKKSAIGIVDDATPSVGTLD